MSNDYDRIAIVTGASRGLGLETAKALQEAGWTLIIDGRDAGDLTRAADEIGDGVIALPGDVSDPEHRQKLIHAAIQAGGLDLLINNASLLGPSPQPTLDSYPLDELRRVYEVNVVAPLALTQNALPFLRQRKGTAINVTSDAATEAYEGWGGYGSSKAALNQMTNILAAEESEISVYSYDPGDMNTRMHQEAFPGEDISDRPPPESSVPGLMALIEGTSPSGPYTVNDVLLAT